MAFEIFLKNKGVQYRALREHSGWTFNNPDYVVYLPSGVNLLCEVKEKEQTVSEKGQLYALFRGLTRKVREANKQIKSFNRNFGTDFMGVGIFYMKGSLDLVMSEAFPQVHNHTMRNTSSIAGIGFLMNNFRKRGINPIVSFKRNPKNTDSRIDFVEEFFK